VLKSGLYSALSKQHGNGVMIIDTQNLADLPLASKVELLEAITGALARSDEFDSPSWHESVLKQREHELQNPSAWLSLEAVKKSLIL
jgi:hypothetical protein